MDKIYSPEKQKYVKVRSKHGQHILHSYNNHMLHGEKCNDCKYSKIVNIHTNRIVSTYGNIGKNIINQYNKITHLHKGGSGIINNLQPRLEKCKADCKIIEDEIEKKKKNNINRKSEFPEWYQNDGRSLLNIFNKQYVDTIISYEHGNKYKSDWMSFIQLGILRKGLRELLTKDEVDKIVKIMEEKELFKTYFIDYLHNIKEYNKQYNGTQLYISEKIMLEIFNIRHRYGKMQSMISTKYLYLNNL